MKIAMVGNMWRSYGEITDECHIRDGFKRLGHQVLDYSWREYPKLLEEKPEVHFILVAKRIAAEQIKELRAQLGAPVFYWNFDLMGLDWGARGTWTSVQAHIEAAAEADGYFGKTVDRKLTYTRWGARYFILPEDAADPVFEKVSPESKRPHGLKDRVYEDEYPVLFTGTCSGSYRRGLLAEIQTGIAPVQLHIAGRNSNVWKRWGFKHSHRAVWDSYYPYLIARSKINLAIDKTHEIEGYWSSRIAKIQACGGFVLARFTVGMERAFGPDEETLVYWDTTEDCVRKIKHYLAYDDDRLKIAERGYQHARKFMSFEYRLRQLLTILRYRYGISDESSSGAYHLPALPPPAEGIGR